MDSELGRMGVFNLGQIQDRLMDEFLGLCRGILFDGDVHEKELVRLDTWMANHPEVADAWPVREIAARVAAVLEDGLVEDAEREELVAVLRGLVGSDPSEGNAATTLPLDDPPPAIVFPERTFVFTGTFVFGTRKACEAEVVRRRGSLKPTGVGLTYYVIGSKATRAWAHSSFGRKIEWAVEARRIGEPVAIVSEKHWVQALSAQPAHDPEVIRDKVLAAIEGRQPLTFLYRGSPRTIQPHALTVWLNQPAVEGLYLGGESHDSTASVRHYLLSQISLVGA